MKNNYIEEFKTYLKKSKFSIIIICVFAIIAFGERIISNGFSIDVEIYIHNLQNLQSSINWNWWISLGRWGAVLLNKILQPDSCLIITSNILTVITMILYSICFNYLFYKYIPNKYQKNYLKYQFIFPLIFITNPIFAEQYNFVHQSFSVAIGLLLVPIAILLFTSCEEIESKLKRTIIYIVGITISVISFGVYQSIILIYIVTVAVCYLLKVIKEEDNCWKYLIKHITLFIIIACIYELISKLLGPKAEYLQMAWMKDGIRICMRNIWYVIKDTIKCEGIYYNIGYLVAIVSFIGGAIYCIIKRKMKIGIVLSGIAIIMSPFYIMFITGVNQLYRTQFNYSYAIGVMLMIIITFLNKDTKTVKSIKMLLVVISIVVIYRQTYTTANLFNTANVTYENDVKIADKIVDRIETKEWYNEENKYKLIFVGTYKQKSLNEYIKGEVIGSSVFEFGKDDGCGISSRANLFLDILGYKFENPSVEEFYEANEYIKNNNIPSYPNDKSITLMDEDTIVVKLSDDIKEKGEIK